jgi:hypothetical protein
METRRRRLARSKAGADRFKRPPIRRWSSARWRSNWWLKANAVLTDHGDTISLVDESGPNEFAFTVGYRKVSAPGQRSITTQLYFDAGEHLRTDIASAVKAELILHPTPAPAGKGREVTYDFVLEAS